MLYIRSIPTFPTANVFPLFQPKTFMG